MSEISMHLHDEFIEVKTKKDSLSQEKVLSYSQLKSLFREETGLDTGLLPGEYGTKRIIINGVNHFYLYLEPAKIVKITNDRSGNHPEPDPDDYDYEEDYIDAYEEWESRQDDSQDDSYRFTAPILCWMVHMEKRNDTMRYVSSYVYALKNPIISGMEPLYRAPFDNIFGGNNVCWGDNEVVLPTPQAIQGLSTLFFNSPSNMDLPDLHFQKYARVYYPGDAFYPVHFQMDVDKMLEEKTPEETLAFVHSKLQEIGSPDNSVTKRFNRFAGIR